MGSVLGNLRVNGEDRTLQFRAHGSACVCAQRIRDPADIAHEYWTIVQLPNKRHPHLVIDESMQVKVQYRSKDLSIAVRLAIGGNAWGAAAWAASA